MTSRRPRTGDAVGRYRTVAHAFLRRRLSFVARTLGRARRQWKFLSALVLAAALLATTATLRLLDTDIATVGQVDLQADAIGVATDTTSPSYLAYKPRVLFTELGGEVPEQEWHLEVDPGRTMRARLSLVLLDADDLWALNVTGPVTVFFRLPDSARLLPRDRTLRADSAGSCASWFDGQAVGQAPTTVERSTDGSQIVSCSVPAIGEVSDLFFEMAFEWETSTRASAGFGRTTDWLLLLEGSDLPWLEDGPPTSGSLLARPVRATLQLGPGERLADSFPEPIGGSARQRVWTMERGGEIQYTLEVPEARTWVPPAIEFSLLAAGFFLGLMPSLWRPRR